MENLMMEESEEIESSDWLEASVLIAHGVEFVGVRRNVNGKCFFRFISREKASELLDAYRRGILEGRLLDFALAQRRIKDLIHSNMDIANVPFKSIRPF